MAFLKRKFGPLPAWGWALLVVVAVGLFILWRKKQASASSATTSVNPSNSIAISCSGGVATCPAGYEDDGTGTCNCVLISSEGSTIQPGTAIPATTPLTSSGTCPPGYQIDPTGTFCQVVEGPAATGTGTTGTVPAGAPSGSIPMPSSGCPANYAPDPTGTFCEPATINPGGPVYVTPSGSTQPAPATTPDSTITPIPSTTTPASITTPVAPAPAPAAPAAVAPPASMAQQAAAAGLCEIDNAEAKLAFAKGLTVWNWTGSSFGSGTKGPTVPTGGTLFGNCSSLAAQSIPHAGA